MRQCGTYCYLSELYRGRIIGLRKGGFAYRDIANRLNQNQSCAAIRQNKGGSGTPQTKNREANKNKCGRGSPPSTYGNG